MTSTETETCCTHDGGYQSLLVFSQFDKQKIRLYQFPLKSI